MGLHRLPAGTAAPIPREGALGGQDWGLDQGQSLVPEQLGKEGPDGGRKGEKPGHW